MPLIYVFMAEGFEEMELGISVDILRRAGCTVKTVTLKSDLKPVLGSRGIAMVPDIKFDDINEDACDMLLLPGGLDGTKNLGDDPRILKLLRKFFDRSKWIAAICAAPLVLLKAGIGSGMALTSHPAAEQHMHGVDYKTERVVTDGKVITSRAAGTSFEFAFHIIELLLGAEKALEVNRGVLATLQM